MEQGPRSTLVDMSLKVPRHGTDALNGVAETAPNTPRVGRLGVVVRVLLGTALIYLVTMEEGTLKWDAEGRDLFLGLVVFPAVMVGVGTLAALALKRPLQMVGPGGVILNGALIIALLTNDTTADPALVFYGVSLLVAAVRHAPGCEMTVISNLVLRRDDQVGCPVLAPLDEVEISGGARTGSQISIKAFGLEIVICIGLIAVLAWRLL